MLPHKIYDEFSPRRILQNIFGTVTCLCVHVCASVSLCERVQAYECVCEGFQCTLGIVAMNCNHNWAGQQLFQCDVAQHFPIFRFMREVPSGLSFILCRCCCCCWLVGCLTTWRSPFPVLQVCPQPVDELYNWNCFSAFMNCVDNWTVVAILPIFGRLTNPYLGQQSVRKLNEQSRLLIRASIRS